MTDDTNTQDQAPETAEPVNPTDGATPATPTQSPASSDVSVEPASNTPSSAPTDAPVAPTETPTDLSVPQPSELDPNVTTNADASPVVSVAVTPSPKGAIAYLENAVEHVLAVIDNEVMIEVHGIEDELRSLRGLALYQLHALKGKLGLL